MDDYEDEGQFDYAEGESEHDIRGITAFLRGCWQTHPTFALGEILDLIFGGSLNSMSDEEVMETLREFLMQNE